VIGGLLCATVATLVFVPAVFSMLHGGKGEDTAAQREHEQQPQHA
jgi:Cu/Ag efflux pump CusA